MLVFTTIPTTVRQALYTRVGELEVGPDGFPLGPRYFLGAISGNSPPSYAREGSVSSNTRALAASRAALTLIVSLVTETSSLSP